MQLYFITLFLLTIVMSCIPQQAAAAGGITVAPAYTTVQVGSKQPEASVTVGVRNNFDVPITIVATMSDLNIHNNSLIPSKNTLTQLSDIITISPAQTVIDASSSKNFIITIKDKTSLAPGGHYLSLLLSQTSGEIGNVTPKLSLKPAVSATIYLIKEDGAVRSLQLTGIALNHSIFSLPRRVDVTFYNNGNVASVPRGVINIKPSRSSNSVFASGIVNTDSVPVFPKNSVTLQVNLQNYSAVSAAGKYPINVSYRLDGFNNVSTSTVYFWYLPKLAAVSLFIMLLIVGLFVKTSSRQFILDTVVNWLNKRPLRVYVPPAIPVDPLKVAKNNKTKKIKVKSIEKIIPSDYNE